MDNVELLSNVTGINSTIIRHEQLLHTLPVAQRMSWAAHRETTRIEDMAYCLLGIFDVNMPLVYGEKAKAYQRLQEEIIKSTADLSIFAWTMPAASNSLPRSEIRYYCGMLAERPLHFAGCAEISRDPGYGGQQFWTSNNGVKTRIQILSEPVRGRKAYRYILPLDCYWAPQRFLGVRLRKCGPDQFVREDPWSLVEDTKLFYPNAPRERLLLVRLPELRLPSDPLISDTRYFIPESRSHALQIQLPSEMWSIDAWPWSRFDDEDQLFFINSNSPGRWDACSKRLGAEFTVQASPQKIDVNIECMFCAVGWAASEASSLQCTLVDYRSFHVALNEVQSQIVHWNPDRHQFLDHLVQNKIPKCSVATFEIPGSAFSVAVSFRPTLVRDKRICRGPFWRVKFSCEIYQSESLPPVVVEDWKFDD